jgi:hypothetical protein
MDYEGIRSFAHASYIREGPGIYVVVCNTIDHIWCRECTSDVLDRGDSVTLDAWIYSSKPSQLYVNVTSLTRSAGIVEAYADIHVRHFTIFGHITSQPKFRDMSADVVTALEHIFKYPAKLA